MDYSTDTAPLSRAELLVAGLTLIACGFSAGVIFITAIVWITS
jgi:hypothetical protein